MVSNLRWLSNMKTLLSSAAVVARSLHEGHATLVHCSHGWDRTPQVCALAEVMLDVYYRTIAGAPPPPPPPPPPYLCRQCRCCCRCRHWSHRHSACRAARAGRKGMADVQVPRQAPPFRPGTYSTQNPFTYSFFTGSLAATATAALCSCRSGPLAALQTLSANCNVCCSGVTACTSCCGSGLKHSNTPTTRCFT